VQELPSGKYQARLTVDGKLTGLGTFDSAKDAAIVYDQAILKYNLPTDKLNFPPQTNDEIKEEPKDDQISSNSQWLYKDRKINTDQLRCMHSHTVVQYTTRYNI